MMLKPDEPVIIILGKSQLLKFYYRDLNLSFHISTAKKGFGESLGSHQTPRGWHYIRAIIGKDAPHHSYYTGRRPSKVSLISSRILWLCGLEAHNHMPLKHSMKRYIYIHGSPVSFKKTPSSLGCINMDNKDIEFLTNKLPKYCKVLIDPE
jgi:hypothetical protein